jgi:hypothetical protein
MNDQTRAWSKKFAAQSKTGSMPSMTVAGLYSGVLHYLKTLEAMGGNSHDGAKVVAKMKELPTDDILSMGLLQAGRDDPGGGGRAAAQRKRVSADQEVRQSQPAGFPRSGRSRIGTNCWSADCTVSEFMAPLGRCRLWQALRTLVRPYAISKGARTGSASKSGMA